MKWGSQTKPYILALGAIFFWSTAATAFKLALKHMDFIQLLFISSLTATVFLFIVLIAQNKINLLRKLSFKDYLKSAPVGLLNPFLYYLVLLKAYSILPAQIAQPLNYTWPIMLVLLSVPFLKQKLYFKSIIAIIISFSGVLIISSQGQNILEFKISNPFGVLLATGSSLAWAMFWILNVKNKKDEVLKLFLNFSFALIFISIVFFVFSKPEKALHINGIIPAVYIGLFEMGIAFILWLKALKLSPSNEKISNLVFISPFLALIFIHIILGEQIYMSTWAGLILIIAGIYIQQKRKK
ncbi:DMT family transporter [Bacteroidota bacterium]